MRTGVFAVKQWMQEACTEGVARLEAWSDLLDRINVFPVADGDTGRNLVATLSSLRSLGGDVPAVTRNLLLSARGNSGNIAALFFSRFLTANTPKTLPEAAARGREHAYQGVRRPSPGTMLDILDSLAEGMAGLTIVPNADNDDMDVILERLSNAVAATHARLPKLRKAGVVDAGALGLFLFFEGFFSRHFRNTQPLLPITDRFKGLLEVHPAFVEPREDGRCIDVVVQADQNAEAELERLSEHSDSVVVISRDDLYKIHLHTRDTHMNKEGLASIGPVLSWSNDDLGQQIDQFNRNAETNSIHIMTDAAGSIPPDVARQYNITLLDSYITADSRCVPETRFPREELYRIMRAGGRVSSAQASVFERRQRYESAVNLYNRVLYLCVGSCYTGNYETAMAWKQAHDPDDRFWVHDTGAASGRLGAVALATAAMCRRSRDAGAVAGFARAAAARCEEYVFLDKLTYLAAGGRIRRSSAFFGDLLHLKPVITPSPQGARKVAAVRNQRDQVAFALSRLRKRFSRTAAPLILLQYTDNESWVRNQLQEQVLGTVRSADVRIYPLSLTSAVHMGPGTWSMAFLPEIPAVSPSE